MANPVEFKKKKSTSLPSSPDNNTFYVQTEVTPDADGTAPDRGSIYVGETLLGKGIKNIQDGSLNNGSVVMNDISNNSSQGQNSVTMGTGTKTTSVNQLATGSYNESTNKALFMVGNGTSDTNRQNALMTDVDGNTYIEGDVYVEGGSYTKPGGNTQSLLGAGYKLDFDRDSIIYDPTNEYWGITDKNAQPGYALIMGDDGSVEWGPVAAPVTPGSVTMDNLTFDKATRKVSGKTTVVGGEVTSQTLTKDLVLDQSTTTVTDLSFNKTTRKVTGKTTVTEGWNSGSVTDKEITIDQGTVTLKDLTYDTTNKKVVAETVVTEGYVTAETQKKEYEISLDAGSVTMDNLTFDKATGKVSSKTTVTAGMVTNQTLTKDLALTLATHDKPTLTKTVGTTKVTIEGKHVQAEGYGLADTKTDTLDIDIVSHDKPTITQLSTDKTKIEAKHISTEGYVLGDTKTETLTLATGQAILNNLTYDAANKRVIAKMDVTEGWVSSGSDTKTYDVEVTDPGSVTLNDIDFNETTGVVTATVDVVAGVVSGGTQKKTLTIPAISVYENTLSDQPVTCYVDTNRIYAYVFTYQGLETGTQAQGHPEGPSGKGTERSFWITPRFLQYEDVKAVGDDISIHFNEESWIKDFRADSVGSPIAGEVRWHNANYDATINPGVSITWKPSADGNNTVYYPNFDFMLYKDGALLKTYHYAPVVHAWANIVDIRDTEPGGNAFTVDTVTSSLFSPKGDGSDWETTSLQTPNSFVLASTLDFNNVFVDTNNNIYVGIANEIYYDGILRKHRETAASVTQSITLTRDGANNVIARATDQFWYNGVLRAERVNDYVVYWATHTDVWFDNLYNYTVLTRNNRTFKAYHQIMTDGWIDHQDIPEATAESIPPAYSLWDYSGAVFTNVGWHGTFNAWLYEAALPPSNLIRSVVCNDDNSVVGYENGMATYQIGGSSRTATEDYISMGRTTTTTNIANMGLSCVYERDNDWGVFTDWSHLYLLSENNRPSMLATVNGLRLTVMGTGW